ncbi:MAG TPA: CIA30 family protein [Orrella sp.]
MTTSAHAKPIILEDFNNATNSPTSPTSPTSPQDRWEFIADTVMGGVSSGNVQFLTQDGQSFLKLSGMVSTANNGGFIQARLPLDQTATKQLPETAQGIWLKTRGNGQKYFVHVRTSGTLLPWQYYQATFEVTDQWQDIKLAWDDFKPSGGLSGSILRDVPLATKVKSIAIVAFGRDHEADIEVAKIGYY